PKDPPTQGAHRADAARPRDCVSIFGVPILGFMATTSRMIRASIMPATFAPNTFTSVLVDPPCSFDASQGYILT
ncbi:MAG: hypothetical protein ACRDG5_02260, partial [Anaerolineales bacterium]